MGIVIFSLFAPSVIPLLDCENDAIVLIDFTEEESKKENKKELEEKDVFFQDLNPNKDESGNDIAASNFYYLLKSSDFKHNIVLPPPERKC